jgi:hypothetical protein
VVVGLPMRISTIGCRFLMTIGVVIHQDNCMKLVSLVSICCIFEICFCITSFLSGHNLNLGHSGEGTVEYGDQSGMMVSNTNLN